MIIKMPTGRYRYRLTATERNMVRKVYRDYRVNVGIGRVAARHVAADTAYVAAALRVVA